MVAEAAASYFRVSGRDFPWRTEHDAFHLAIAEILLQKTRARSVVATYTNIVADYPTPARLSNASSEELEVTLRPLGLSRKRAEQLIGMANAVQKLGDSAFDDWRVVLRDVPGLGAYAARAIACFGRSEALGIVDANVARILRRVYRIGTGDPRAVTYQHHADEIAHAADDVRAANFGLLDIGAAICLRVPRCTKCPLLAACRYGQSVAIAETGRSIVPAGDVRPVERGHGLLK